MKVFVILECYTDYKGGNATSFGVFKTLESAKEHLPQAVVERLGFDTIEEWEEEYGDCFENYMTTNRCGWCKDSGDDVMVFCIQEDELED